MPFLFVVVGLIQGLLIVGFLAVVQAVAIAFLPTFVMPFSIWWGMIMSVPAIAGGFAARKF